MIYRISNKVITFVLFSFLIILFSTCTSKKKKSILIFSARNVNTLLPSVAASHIQDISLQNKIDADTTTDISYIVEDSIKQYSALVLIDLEKDLVPVRTQQVIERFVQAGGGLALIHSQKTTKFHWPWYNKLVDAKFTDLSDSAIGTDNKFELSNGDHTANKDLPVAWTQNDIVIPVNNVGKENTILLQREGKPISWCNSYDGGHIFYTAAGGTIESYKNENFLKHILGGINYLLEESSQPDYKKVHTVSMPEENRFLQLVLDTYLNEPIEMEVLKDGRVIFIERHGKVKLYDPKLKATRLIASFDVRLTGNYEDGLLGMELDPDFEKNQFLYLYYSVVNKPMQNLSRFEFNGDSLELNSEKVVLQVPVQIETCCHSAGNVYFGIDGNLYLSTGDNTSSKESDGFTPIDERPGRGPFDAQKSSANTHDLRGKILRIHVEKDGSYTIPDGNLFKKDGSEGRPEIYVMGTRNPYRIVTDKRGYLYWGDVGPDGGVSNARGPKSHDEWNQARKPGNFGWPYFIANNISYADFNFATNEIGPLFDPKNPTNNSPYNYGSKKLPTAQPAMIYYSYDESKEFPMLGTGSRSAMAGPFYYIDNYSESNFKFPEYYNEKLFIFDWGRSTIKAISFSEEGDLQQIEPFLPGIEFFHPIDIKFGSDGAMYVLQYGSNYFARNSDAQLVRLEYTEGNRQPTAQISASKTVGGSPLTIKLSGKKSFDYDMNATLTYSWQSGAGETSSEVEPTFTYKAPGIYKPILTVSDNAGSVATASIDIKVGNEIPEVDIILQGNRSFYFDKTVLPYKVSVSDKEDGTLQTGIDMSMIRFNIDYLAEGKDMGLLSSHSNNVTTSLKYIKGKTLMDGSDCKSCHAVDKKSVGPSWQDVAKRYKNDAGTISKLAKKVINGGNGSWGKTMMAAHPQLNKADTEKMIEYILSLNGSTKNLPLEGTYTANQHSNKEQTGFYVISASYTDKGSSITGALTGSKIIILRNSLIQAEDFDAFYKVGVKRPINQNIAFVSDVINGSSISLKSIDLKGIDKLLFKVKSGKGGRIEVRIDSSNGKVLGSVELPKDPSNADWKEYSALIKDPGGLHDLFLVFNNDEVKTSEFMNLDWVKFVQATR